MVKCPNCGNENRDGLKVCLHCGSNLPGYVEPEPEKRKSPKDPESRKSPKEPKRDSSSHKLRNTIIIVLMILLFLCLATGLGGLSNMDSNYDNSILLSDDSSNAIDGEIYSQSSSTENDDSSSVFNLKKTFSSPDTLDFDGLFTMDVDGNLTFVENNNSDYGADREWGTHYNEHVSIHDERMFLVYYWENIEPSEILNEFGQKYGFQYEDENLIVFDHEYNTGDSNTFSIGHEYIACVTSGNKVVGVSGTNFDKVKEFAESIKFS